MYTLTEFSSLRLTDDGKDADSLLDETVANSNQNNSNCSSPSRMSDSVSLTTDSSQDNSLCTPEREAKMPFLPKSRWVKSSFSQGFLRMEGGIYLLLWM